MAFCRWHQRKFTIDILLILVLVLRSNALHLENVTAIQNAESIPQANQPNSSSVNLQTELIEYYDVDDAPAATDIIYPNPDEVLLRTNRHNNDYIFDWNKQYGATSRLSELKEMDGDGALSESRENLVDHNTEFRGKSIDFDNTPDGMNNADLRDHGIIDNFMYVYYGPSVPLRNNMGGSIIIAGAVFALAAQILTAVFTMLRYRQIRRTNNMATISLNLLLTLCASNLLFIVGVQTSKNAFKCETIAILLHYFHLSTAAWGLCHAFAIYNFVLNGTLPVMKINNLGAYGLSAVYVLFSFAISNSYEIYDYCWMSAHRGMIFNFMIPVALLILLTTIFGTMSLRAVTSHQRQVIVESIENILDKCHHIDATVNCNWNGDYLPTLKCCDELQKRSDELQKNYENSLKSMEFYDSKFDLGALSIAELSLQSANEVQDYGEYKRAIKFTLFFQPAFCVCWFLGVLAMETRHSVIMPIVFVVCYNILNWYILFRFHTISPLIMGQQQTSTETTSEGGRKSDQFTSTLSVNEQENQTQSCTDTIPLLCSVTVSANVTTSDAPNMVNAIETTVNNGSSIVTLHSSEVSLTRSMSMEDILYKTSMTQWDSNNDYSNVDCISTISN